MMSKFGK